MNDKIDKVPFSKKAEEALAKNGKITDLKGTYFFGGAGTNQDYISDMLSALKEAGILNVKAGHILNSIGGSVDMIENFPYDDMMLDALAVTSVNQTGYYLVIGRDEFNLSGSQLNFIGYSYGAIVASIKALSYANVYKGTVDHLVLIGAPINSDLLEAVKTNKYIKNVIVLNLKKHDDPIYAGMSDFEIIGSIKDLVPQMYKGDGHFWYSGSPPIGNDRRRNLAQYLYNQGLR